MEQAIDLIQDESIYSNIVQKHDIYTEIINKALAIVEQFIIDRKLILYGGMAIDMALRKKGSHIYEDNAVPDYDFLSSEFHKDAYDLGQLLAQQDFPNISVINAIHPSTMKVRVNYENVADISYCPKNIYSKIPTQQYGKMQIIHPTFQFIDQHRSLSFPYENPPREVITHRWRKDMHRHELLYSKYPILATSKTKSKNAQPQTHYQFQTDLLANQCIGGLPAIIFWVQSAKALGFEFKHANTSQMFKSSIITDSKIDIYIPSECLFTVLSDDLWFFIKKIKSRVVYEVAQNAKKGDKSSKNKANIKTCWYNAILDKFPRHVKITSASSNGFEVFDNDGSFLAAHKPWEDLDVYVGNLQSVMGYLLVMYFWDVSRKDMWGFYYNICRDVVSWAADAYHGDASIDYLKFLPTSETYGKHNWSEIYLLGRRDFKIKIEELPRLETPDKPKSAFPSKDDDIKPKLYEYDPSASPIYQFDGLLRKTPFTPTTLPE